MRVNKTEKYVVTYYFVDNTYWDDGNRFTSRSQTFPSEIEARCFIEKIAKDKLVTERSSVTGKIADFFIKDVQLKKYTEEFLNLDVIIDH